MNSMEFMDWRVPVRAVLASAVLLVSGCSQHNTPPEPILVVQEDWGPCEAVPIKGKESPSINPADARLCAAYMQDGTVDVINFGVDGDEATAMAKRMEQQLTIASKGLLTMHVKVVNATPAAKQELQHLAPGGCLAGPHAASAADRTMPELNPRDIKVALSPVSDCESKLRAKSDNRGEYVDVYWSLLSKERGYRIDEGVYLALHELLHDLELGHKGVIFSNQPKEGYPALLSGQAIDHFDADEYLTQIDYLEYGVDPADLMGNPATDKDFTLDPIHLNRLRWPLITMQGQQVSNERILQIGEVHLDSDDALQGRFVSVHLQQAISLKDEGLPPDTAWDRTHSFDTVYFRPIILEDGSIGAFELCLGDAQTNLASFGVLGVGTKPTIVSFGTQRFIVSMQNQNFLVVAS